MSSPATCAPAAFVKLARALNVTSSELLVGVD